MAVIYVALIIKGKRTYKDVPDVIKPKVKQMLSDLDLEEFIVEWYLLEGNDYSDQQTNIDSQFIRCYFC